MKYISLILITLCLASITIAQSVIVKDSETEPNTLLEINDEGATGSISIPTGTAPSEPAGKLYNESGTLKWSGNVLSTGSSLWTLGGYNVYRTLGNVGIGTVSPSANLHVYGNEGVLVQGTYHSGTAGTTQNLGAGTRMHFYPKKGAFRAGYVKGTQWDDANIGFYSTAMGYSTTASGDHSTAMGGYTTASGYYSTAMGGYTTASGYHSTAMGYYTTASGYYSTAMGRSIEASGDYSIAISLKEYVPSTNVTQANTMAIMGGKVGIGILNPSYILDVVGNVNFNGAIYQRGSSLYSDYVFEDDYDLETIQEHSDFM